MAQVLIQNLQYEPQMASSSVSCSGAACVHVELHCQYVVQRVFMRIEVGDAYLSETLSQTASSKLKAPRLIWSKSAGSLSLQNGG